MRLDVTQNPALTLALRCGLLLARQSDVDLLSLFLLAKDADTGASLPDHEVVDEAFLFLIAGHETTAGMLAWALYLVCCCSLHRGCLGLVCRR